MERFLYASSRSVVFCYVFSKLYSHETIKPIKACLQNVQAGY